MKSAMHNITRSEQEIPNQGYAAGFIKNMECHEKLVEINGDRD